MIRDIYKLFFAIFFFASNLYSSQVVNIYEVVAQYKMQYKTDSTSKFFNKENFLLFLNADGYSFLSTKEYKRDSLLKSSTMKPFDIKMKFNSKNSYFINYSGNSKELHFSDRLVDQNWKYIEKNIMDWKLLNETKIINGTKCFKATTFAFGRDWVAWYSIDYSFPFGPYKFNGLPGLIFEIYDTKNTYIFSLFEIKKDFVYLSSEIHKDPKLVTKEQFLKAVSNINSYQYIFNNVTFDDPNQARRIREGIEREQKNKNNPIELIP